MGSQRHRVSRRQWDAGRPVNTGFRGQGSRRRRRTVRAGRGYWEYECLGTGERRDRHWCRLEFVLTAGHGGRLSFVAPEVSYRASARGKLEVCRRWGRNVQNFTHDEALGMRSLSHFRRFAEIRETETAVDAGAKATSHAKCPDSLLVTPTVVSAREPPFPCTVIAFGYCATTEGEDNDKNECKQGKEDDGCCSTLGQSAMKGGIVGLLAIGRCCVTW